MAQIARRFGASAAAAFVLVALVACQASAPVAIPAPSATSTVASAQSPAASGSPSPGASAAERTTRSPDACRFLPPEAVGSALGVNGVTAEPTPGDGDFSYCNYAAPDGTSLLATSYTTTQGFVFDSYAAGEDVVEVPGVGDAAIFTQGLLMIRQGPAVFSIQAGETGLADDELLPALTDVAEAAAANLGD